jgi:hypothetical protein
MNCVTRMTRMTRLVHFRPPGVTKTHKWSVHTYGVVIADSDSYCLESLLLCKYSYY